MTDFDGDGQLDLLVGDFASVPNDEELSAEQKADAEQAQQEYQKVLEQYTAAYENTDLPNLMEKMRAVAKEARDDPEKQASAREKHDELMKQYRAIQQKELRPLLDRLGEIRQRLPRSNSYHGFVWLYLRNSEPKPPDSN